jgi:hypothetical protein
MPRMNLQRGLSCQAVMWSHQGPVLQTDDASAFRYEVREYGNLIGFITADCALSHPDVMWNCSHLGEDRPFADELKTVDEAFAAF